MKQENTTPQWILELKEKREKEKRTERARMHLSRMVIKSRDRLEGFREAIARDDRKD